MISPASPKRWLLSAAALLSGLAVSAALLVYSNPDAGGSEVLVAAADLPAGAPLGSGAARLQRMRLQMPARLFFGRGAEAELARHRAGHDLIAGQLIQRSDLAPILTAPDLRLVWLAVKDAPPAAAGDRVDLLLLSGAGDRATVAPFALGVPVHAAQAGGLVLRVPSAQAAAYVYAAANLRLAAVLVEPGSPPGLEAPVNSPEQAVEAVTR